MLHKNKSHIRRAKPLLGTVVEISVFSAFDEFDFLNELTAKCFDRIDEIQKMMSFFDESSDISRLNLSLPYTKVLVFPETAEVLMFACKMYAESNGSFDVMYRKRKLFPSAEIIFHEPCHISKTAEVTLDLGGIAKGYAVDEAVKIFQTYEHLSGVINAGGDIRFFGKQHFDLSIRSPLHNGQYFNAGFISNCSIATSVFDNDSSPVSISIIASSCMVADSLTKAIYGADVTKKADLLSKYAARYLILDPCQSSGFTPGFEGAVI